MSDIVGILAGLLYAQRELGKLLRSAASKERAARLEYYLMAEAKRYAAQLPPNVVAQLDQVELVLLRRRTGRSLDVEIAGRIASEEAFAQTIRATNHDRKQEELSPLGADGWP